MTAAAPIREPRPIPLAMAMIPVVFLIAMLSLTIIVFKLDAHIPLIIASAVAALVASAYGHSWFRIREGMMLGIHLAMGAILILMVIGTMIGTWMLAGIVPSMIYYGLQLISPAVFLVATLLICSIVSLGTGSSWSTAGTVGVALTAVGQGLGIPAPMVAGAIISGAYFGDKMSPLSDTTNLAPAVAGTDVFSHIRHMIYTTTPGYLIALGLYALLGSRFSGGEIHSAHIDRILSAISGTFFIHPVLLLPLVLVILMVVLKIPPLPALFGGTLLGGVFAVVFQHESVARVFAAAHSGYVADTGVKMVDNLLTRGGLESMMSTVALILCALSFGGIMEKSGMLNTIARALLHFARSTGSLVLTTVLSCIGMNAIAADQYMAIVIPGRMFKNAFEARGLHPKNLSRCLEDSATLTSSLIPWNSGGAFMYATLGVYPLHYLPFAFMNLTNPIISVIYGYTGFTMTPADPPEGGDEGQPDQPAPVDPGL